MTELQTVALVVLVPFVLIGLVIAWYLLMRLTPFNRHVIRRVSETIPTMTGRPIRGSGLFSHIELVGRDGDRVFVRVSFADAKTFGTDAGAPRCYFAYSLSADDFTSVTVGEVRPFKYRSSWCWRSANMVFTQGRGCRRWRVIRLARINRFGRVPSGANPRSPTLFGDGR